MAYSDFTVDDLEQRFGIALDQADDLFGGVPEVDLSECLSGWIDDYVPVAQTLTTEKARSELLVAPMLFELRKQYADRLSVFSGIEFAVDPAAGLTGRCDYIIARSPRLFALRAPACVIVEAKNENIIGGIPQCVAGMVAAQRFNAAASPAVSATVYGAVTSGLAWRFLRLDGPRAAVDGFDYPIQNARKIVGILTHMALGEPAPARPATAA